MRSTLLWVQASGNVMQFSITLIEYDPATLAQFAAKKQSFLNAEKSKAQRQEEVQRRLMIEEQGLRQIAEIQAAENQKKERAVIEASQKEEVANSKLCSRNTKKGEVHSNEKHVCSFIVLDGLTYQERK